MYKAIFLVACLFTGIYSYGQEIENNFIFRLDGNYNEVNTNNMLQNINAYSAVSKNGNVSLSAGYKHRNWLFGLGFEYSQSKTTAIGKSVYKQHDAQPFEITAFGERNEITLNMYGGVLYTSYYLPIYRNLYFTPGFFLGYGCIKGDYRGAVELTLSNFSISNSGYYEGEISPNNYFYMQLSPELTWFFSNHFGLNLQMGGLGINAVDSDWSKQINFNPSFWKLGILFKI